MIKLFKMIVICALGSIALSSCLSGNEGSQIYTEVYSVIKSDVTGMYFSSDDGISLYPAGGFDAKWGNVGDRRLVGFYYNPYTISETTTRLDITVQNLMYVQTLDSALPSTVDTVGTGVFVFENSSNQHAISAWASQNYLTARFALKYSDASKHTFGFIEDPTLYRNDTLCLSLWHNTKEEGQNATSWSHIALNLSDYASHLSMRDSTVILLKYKAEAGYSSDVKEYSYPVIYRLKYNLSGY